MASGLNTNISNFGLEMFLLRPHSKSVSTVKPVYNGHLGGTWETSPGKLAARKGSLKRSKNTHWTWSCVNFKGLSTKTFHARKK